MKPFNKLLVLLVAVLVCIDSPAQNHCVLDHSRPITLEGGQYKPTRFGQTQRDFHLKGNFTAHGGKISVYICDAENFANLINGKKFTSFYSAVKKTEGEFDVALAKGHYHLVWWNESAYDSRVIEAEVCFSYPE